SEDPVLWAEAGKVAAWTAEYDKSIDFFTRGLELFPDNLNMRVNLALTYLWMARDDEAQEAFNAAFGSAEDDPEKLTELAWIEEVNGYPQYAQEVYEKSIGLFPEYLEFYLLLQSSYLSSGDSDAADEVGRRIESTFISSAQLQNKLEIYKKKLSLRDEVLDSYLDRLKEDPGNLELRQELSQTYFWNGLSGEAIEQIKYVIITHSYRAAGTWMRRNSELLVLLDSTASAAPFYSAYQAAAADAAKMINTASADLVKAKKAAESEEDKTALRNAEQTLADSIAAASQLAGLGDEMTEALNGWDELVKTVLETEKSENEAFNQAVSASGWQWDKSWQINELEEIMQEERELASYMLSRIFFSDRNYRSAASVLTPEPQAGEVVVETTETAENAEAQTAEGATAAGTETELDYSSLTIDRLYALYQAMLLGGDETGRRALYDKERQRLEAEYPHLAVVEERLSLLDNLQFDNAAGVYFEGIEVEAADVIKTLTDHGKEVSDEQKRLALILSQLTAVAEKELERANYYLEADTYLIRYELGNYYLEDGLNNKASEQFRRVVNVDPWNISAAYKLGIVEQRYGNWSEAMKYYKKVYYQDPNYENTVYYFNQLARTHADTTSAKFQLIVSPAEIALTGELDWKTEFNSFIGMGIDYNLDQQRLYRDLDGEQKGSFQVHMLEASVPFTLSTIGLSLTPEIGFYAESIFYKTDLFFFNGDPAGDLPADVVTIPEFLETISVYPIFGASLNWIWNSLTVNASWRNVIEPDTFYEERDIIRKNDIELNINTWFDFENDLLGPLTTRTYSRLQFMDDEAGNVKWQVLQDAMLGFNILSNPITRLSPSVTVNYEDATEAVGQGYYSPQKVLELKGGLRSSFIFPSADWSRAFEAVIRGAGGGYWSRLGEPEQVLSVKAEAGIEANWIKNSNHYYLNLGWLQTFNEDDTEEYWEISLSLGTSLKLPGLLTK
ncbi:MAG TPA: hypothetical protein DCO79_11705, partial [Spirochaeta sp.]|nr:hypothetical protein [Spirochaeta sp.]